MKITRKVGMIISICVGFVLGAVFSAMGMLSSGQSIPVPGIIIGVITSALISAAISGLIGTLISMKDITDKLALKLGINPITAKLKYNLLQALIGDLIFTPILCTFFIIKNVGFSNPQFVMIWLRSLGLDLLIAYVLTFFLCPLFKKLAAKILGLGKI